ncbi:MAG: AAA family ATPase [Blautia sp.]|nr:AAA family ATPase [Lachnoclostridium sp.]MCM1211923.1 AAA family ATPase [Blautia sp.]
MFRRKIYDKLVEWKETAEGKTALLVEGARRIGKSTVVEAFAKREYKTYILIDFSMASKSVRALFDDMSDLDYFFLQLQLQYKTDLYERESLIIFDEVQLCPLARQAIKALVKDRRYDYIETGSLISIRKNVKDILIPSEERKMNMFPMDYEEFMWALGDTTTNGLLKTCFDAGRPFGDAVHRKLLRDFRLYMLVGGMPQAVSEYIETNNFRKVDEVKRDILNLYNEDFMKIDSTGKISLLFRAVPAQLNSNASRYQVSSVIDGERADTVLELIAQMKESKTVLVAYHANDPAAGLAGNINLGKFKMFFGDTGLFVTQMFRDREFTENIIYEKLLNDKLPGNLGYLYENVMAQTLVVNGKELYYHTMMNEVSRHNYEVDFLLAEKNKICPVEVKSSGYKTHKSLDVFTEKFSDRILRRYLVYTKDYRKEQDVICLPVYMAQFL